MTTRVRIDPNSTTRDGLVKARLSHVEGEIEAPLQIVHAFEPDDAIHALALVDHVDHTRGWVYLRVNWDSMVDLNVSLTPSYAPAVAVNRAQAAVQNRVSNSAAAAAAFTVRGQRLSAVA